MMTVRRVCWLFLLLVITGCNKQDTEALTRIGKKVHARAEVVTGDVKTSAVSSWQAIGDAGVEGRVAARLRWDNELEGAHIEVLPSGNGVELRGIVRSLEQRRRALMLASSTTGVDGVKDSLTSER